jgi:hypothetical protein
MMGAGAIRGSRRNMSTEIKKEIQLEIAHVLFMDIVGYSKLSINEQGAAVPPRSRFSLGSRRKWANPTAPLPLYRNYSRYRTLVRWLKTSRLFPRCSGSIRCGTIRASSNSAKKNRSVYGGYD